ncbi:tetratricopeptide repeat protein [Pararhodobacter sp.]|uniref:tetratricopeptide repeat protein n=1 Tax=Pararhodobacter sp. TaxID=2127056 RepID=UPI002FE40E4E
MRAIWLAVMMGVLTVGGLPRPVAAQNTPAAVAADLATARRLFTEGRYAEGLAILRPAAEAGDPVAQNIVGVAYDDGLGYAADPVAARYWLTRAAEAGDARAQLNLGQLLRDGRSGIAVDMVAARHWIQSASDLGYGPASSALGRMVERGIGGPVDLSEALRLYRIGQAAGDPWASEYLAHLYLNGTGVPQDEALARRYFSEAAAGGVAQAQSNYGYMLETGAGGPVDLAQAEALYRQAMTGGYARAGYNLAWLLDGQATDRASSEEVAAACDWALSRADPEERVEWFDDCATLRKRGHRR